MNRVAHGLPALAAADAYPSMNPPPIELYYKANGIVLGKTNLAEMQATITSINPHANGITTPLNAYDPTRIAGGETLAIAQQPVTVMGFSAAAQRSISG